MADSTRSKDPGKISRSGSQVDALAQLRPLDSHSCTSSSSLPLETEAPIVKETKHISIDYNPVSGRKTLNTYEIVRELGRGEHGRVKLGLDVGNDTYVAIKVINRKEKPRLGRPQTSSKIEKVYREIAILKKCQHPNIVQLLEVLDDENSRKIYLVLEYCRKGEIRWQLPNGDPALTREQARSVARDLALGLEYLHMNKIIHRDIKPANLLVADDNVVKISDFGVSYLISDLPNPDAGLELAKTVGTPAFFSPELCIPTEIQENGQRKQPKISSKLDVWAFGVTLFCLLHGHLPFDADNEYELFRVIAHDTPEFPERPGDVDLAEANDMLRQLLIKDPTQRPTIAKIKHHPWYLKNLSPEAQKDFLYRINQQPVEVSAEEVDHAIQGVSIKSRIKERLSWFADQVRPNSKGARKPKSGTLGKRLSGLSLGSNSSSNSSLYSSHRPSDYSSRTQPPPDLPHPPRAVFNTHMPSDSLSSLSDEPASSLSSSIFASDSNPHGQIVSGKTVTFGDSGGETPEKSSTPAVAPFTTTSRSPQSVQRAAPADLSSGAARSLPVQTRLPELDLASMDKDSFWDEQSSSSSSDDDNGELTLVVGRHRSRSMERGNPPNTPGQNTNNNNTRSLDPGTPSSVS